MFVRVKSNLLLHRLPSAAKALKLSAWEAAAAAMEIEAAAAGRRPNVTERILGEAIAWQLLCLAACMLLAAGC